MSDQPLEVLLREIKRDPLIFYDGTRYADEVEAIKNRLNSIRGSSVIPPGKVEELCQQLISSVEQYRDACLRMNYMEINDAVRKTGYISGFVEAALL